MVHVFGDLLLLKNDMNQYKIRLREVHVGVGRGHLP